MMLITAKFTDYTDSIYIKMFAKSAEMKKMVPKILKKEIRSSCEWAYSI